MRIALTASLVLAAQIVPAQSPVSATVRVDPSKSFQTIEGWGGSLYPQTLAFLDSDPEFRGRLLDELGTTHVRMRSVWYLLEAQNDNDDPTSIDFDAIAAGDTGLVHDELVFQKLLSDAGIVLQFASWRFPYWMIDRPPDWEPTADERPALPEEMNDEYVEAIAAYLLYARDRYGIVFDAISIANEPDIGIYIAGLTPVRLLDLSRRLDQVLETHGYSSRFYLPDVAAADSIGMQYTREFFSLNGAGDFADALAFHSYRRESPVLRYYGSEAGEHHLPVWVTELSHTHLAVDDRLNWSHALANAVCLYDVLSESNASLLLYWSLVMSSSRGLGLYIPEEQRWAAAYDMLKHFFNDIPIVSTRISAHASGPEGLKALAFVRPDGKTVVTVIQSGPEVVELNVIQSGGLLTFDAAIVSQTLDVRNARLPALPIVLPPRSVSTLLFSSSR